MSDSSFSMTPCSEPFWMTIRSSSSVTGVSRRFSIPKNCRTSFVETLKIHTIGYAAELKSFMAGDRTIAIASALLSAIVFGTSSPIMSDR